MLMRLGYAGWTSDTNSFSPDASSRMSLVVGTHPSGASGGTSRLRALMMTVVDSSRPGLPGSNGLRDDQDTCILMGNDPSRLSGMVTGASPNSSPDDEISGLTVTN